MLQQHQVEVAQRLTSPHPYVLATKRYIDSQESASDGLIDGATENTLTIQVSRKSFDRAFRLFDALLKYWEHLGGVVRPIRKSFDQTLVTSFSVGQDCAYLRLEEITEVIDRKAPRWQRKHRPTGFLRFSIDSYAVGLRKSWADGKRQMLEDHLGSLVDGLLAQVEEQRMTRLDNECTGRQKAAAQERREFSTRAHQAETKRREELMVQVQRWHQAREIRAYLDHLKEMVESGRAKPRDPDQHYKWREWAYWYADMLDPTCAPGESPLAEAPPGPVNAPSDSLDLTRLAKRAIAAMGIRDTDGLSRLTRKEVHTLWSDRPWAVWEEIGRVLEGLGYDVAGR
jgi:hypothetical protein